MSPFDVLLIIVLNSFLDFEYFEQSSFLIFFTSNSKISSLEYDRSQLNFINELQPKDEKNKLSDLIESPGCYFNDDEAVRIKICLQGIFLNRVQNTENELRKFKITENGL